MMNMYLLITPTIKANINPLIESPPNKKIANNTTNVVNRCINGSS